MNDHYKQECLTCPVRLQCVYHCLDIKQLKEFDTDRNYLERKKGSILYNEGFPASEFFMIIEGIVKKTTDIKKIGEVILNFNKGGDFIGLNAAGSNSVYTNSIAAFSNIKFCMFSDHLIIKFMKENNKVFNFIIKRFNETTDGIRKRMISLRFGNAKKRTAETLIMLQEQNKDHKNRIDVSREDLAMLIGITRETVARTLSKFKSSKIISFDKRCIIIEQPEKLLALTSTY